jgi:hypothetical protein
MADRSAASKFGVVNVCAGDVPEEFREGAAFEVRTMLSWLDDVEWSFEPVHLDVVLAADLAARTARVEEGYHGAARRGSVYGTVGVRGVTLYADDRSPLRSTIVLDGGYWTRDDTESTSSKPPRRRMKSGRRHDSRRRQSTRACSGRPTIFGASTMPTCSRIT